MKKSSTINGVSKASDSSISIDFYYQNVRCRERIKLAPTKANLKYCERWRASIEHEIATGKFDYAKHFPMSKKIKIFNLDQNNNTPLVKDALDNYIRTSKQTLARSTWMDYKHSTFNHLMPVFGEMRLDEIKRSDVKAWASSLVISQKRLNNLLLPLRAILTDAYEDELISRNPLFGYTPKPNISYQPSKAKKVDPFSPQELKAICEAFKDDSLANQVIFSAWTGLRPSELIALKWEQVDLISNKVRVDKAFVQGREKGTKTNAGTRDVELLAPALSALMKQKSITFRKSEHVFLNTRTNEPWTSYKPFREYVWKPALKIASVRYRKPHQLRHTYASMMISADENIKWIANQMGHTDIVLVSKVYSDWMPSMSATKAGDSAVALWEDFDSTAMS